MFGWGGGIGLTPVGCEPEKERRPPSAPTSLDFPVHISDTTGNERESSLREIGNILGSIKKPQDISADKFEAFNLRVEHDVPASAIVRQDIPNSSPLLPWEDDSPNPSPSTEDGSPILLENGNPYPPKERFEVLKDELLLDNDDAFREVGRLPPRDGRQRVRVTQARKFWMGLERMSQYWDTSLDRYYERPATPRSSTPQAGSEDTMQTDDKVQPTQAENQAGTEINLDNQSNGSDLKGGQAEFVTMYQGRRIGTGHEMPEDVREETIRALTEMAAWPFGCQVALPIMPPRLTLGTLLFPIRQTFEVARSPKDRQLARSGVMEGPLLAAQCRPETSFRAPQEAVGSGIGEVCDLFRELGSMLLAAQERLRQGAVEVKPGEGKWWTVTPRWGGAFNDVVGDNGNFSHGEDTPTLDAGNSRKRSKYDHPFLAPRRPNGARRLSNAERWRLVQPGPSLWDRRMRYIQIGKSQDSAFDDIYMLSSINHHLAILHLRVHRRYIEVLTTGDSDFPPDSDTEDQPWSA
ncbi:hypothetical protein N8T08_009000 [Aspergillus melleus]|uniref:Uncharacterized protein n=1 Tax=Aspergillus melleus TaxID=138277 RepID=A0ACC3AUQ2_9EURO|nr:hypothetical protein N8T08_009000 [Aspergillus melleus]